MADAESAPLLLQLPDTCLLEVLQCLAGDPASLCSAARAHIWLHQAAVVALNSIRKSIKTEQHLVSSLLPYLAKHGQHVNHISLYVPFLSSSHTISLRQLPSMNKLTSLVCSNFELQLHAADGFQGVLGASRLPLKQLQLEDCTLLDGAQELAAALSLLPGLEQLQLQLQLAKSGGYFPT